VPGVDSKVGVTVDRVTSGWVDRGDLVAALDRAAARKVTVISAPAGSGKTSLLRAWADRPGQPRRLAAVQVQPGQHDAPPQVHAVLAFRRDLPLRLHQLRLAGELAEIRAAELRFSERETRALLAASGIALSEGGVALLHQRTEGWVAGLRLAALSLAGHPDPERFVAEFSGSDRTVAEYLFAEMLERQPPAVQDLLLRTCLLDRINGELADLLTGHTKSDRTLLDLEDANAFVVSLDPGRT
jgi:ATP/maltotriose-dependent transcriptional regulator MalT